MNEITGTVDIHLAPDAFAPTVLEDVIEAGHGEATPEEATVFVAEATV